MLDDRRCKQRDLSKWFCFPARVACVVITSSSSEEKFTDSHCLGQLFGIDTVAVSSNR
jgi:hypothetical protein